MPIIELDDAIEKLAAAIEGCSPIDLPYYYKELFPRRQLPDVSGDKAKAIIDEMTRTLRTQRDMGDVVDLWRVVFSDSYVRYDEEEDGIRYNEGKPWYMRR